MEIIITVIVIALFVLLKRFSDSNNMEKQLQKNPSPKIKPDKEQRGRRNQDYEVENSIEDNFEEVFNESKIMPLNISKSIRIKYRSGNNNKSERDIDILELGLTYNNDIMIEAYCNLRHEERTFYVERMTQIIDLDTGEVIKNRKSFFKELVNQYLKSSKYKEDLRETEQYNFMNDFKEKYNDILIVMGYIVRVDGSFNKKEREIVYEYMHKLNDSPLLTEDLMKRIMKVYGLVSYQSFQNRVRKLGDNPPFDLIELSEKIIATKRIVSTEEQKVLNYLEKRFKPKEVKVTKTPMPQELNEVCPRCGSNNTLKKGLRETKNHINQRYYCNTCERIFSAMIKTI